MIDKRAAQRAFLDYTANFDASNSLIKHKITHTLRVAGLCDRIAAALSLPPDMVDVAWLLGLLHDIGRFEQVKEYGTFFDALSVDHAELGADILFRDNLIEKFPVESIAKEWLAFCERAIRLHNKLSLPDDLAGDQLLMAHLIRDADKLDIFRIIAEVPWEERLGASAKVMTDAAGDEGREGARPEVMAYIYRHQCIPRNIKRSKFELNMSHCCMAFELHYEISRQIAKEQGFLAKSLVEGWHTWNEREKAQMDIMKKEIEKCWGMEL